METFLRELRYACRVLAKSPGFSLTAVLTLALGIGASTAVFSVVDGVMLRPLPYNHPERIVRIWEQAPDGHKMNLADANFVDFRAQNDAFSTVSAYGFGLTSIAGGTEPVRANSASVARNFFETFGLAPVVGRTFVPAEEKPHGAPAAVVSYRYWRRYLGASTDLSKFQLRLDGGVYPVVGVMPQVFDFPQDTAVWISDELDGPTTSRTGHNWRGVGRIKEGVPFEQARANLSAIAHRIRAEYGKNVNLVDVSMAPLGDAMVTNVRTALLTLLGAVGLLMLVAAANVAGLLLARNSARHRELALRAALGAGRGRLMAQCLAEAVVLAAAGGSLGILLAAWAVKAAPALLPENLPRRGEIVVDGSMLLFAVAASLVVAGALGVFAAWRAGRGDLREALSAGSRGQSEAGASQRFRSLVVVGEIAATLVILAGAGLLGRSFMRLVMTDPGFNPRGLVTIEFSPAGLDWKAPDTKIAQQTRLMENVLDRLRTIPGVDSAGLVGAMPVAAGATLSDGTFLILNSKQPPTNFEEFGRIARNPELRGQADYCVAGEAYFRAMGIPLVRGRYFGDQDVQNSPHVAVISEALAKEKWAGKDPIGQTLEFGNMDGNLTPLTVVGVVGDVRGGGLDQPASRIIYVNYRQRGLKLNSSPTIVLRSTAPLGQIVASARPIFTELAPDAPAKFSTFENEMGEWLASRRFLLVLVGTFAGVALALAAVGIYGVVAFAVTRRTQEIGIRMALGAQRTDVLRMVVGQGFRLAAAGIVVGLAAAFAVTRYLESLLFGVSAMDPAALAFVSGVLLAVALIASYVPARRAMRLDPGSALRW
ncbi:MAG: ABC transporter permease [Acidobacteria bacterium]|nr:ABC transporter permease [Acidobacteriota bacterium]